MSGAEFALGTLPISVIPQSATVPPVDLMQVDFGSSASAVHALGHTLGDQAAHGVAAGAEQVLAVGATCLGVAALAVLATYATVKGTEALARGLATLDRELEQREKCHARACDAAALWEHAVDQVVDLNARTAALRGTIRREFGDDPDLPKPPPMEIGAKSLQEVYDECALRRAELERAQAAVDAKLAEVTAARLAASLPSLEPALVPAARRIAARRAEHSDRRAERSDRRAERSDRRAERSDRRAARHAGPDAGGGNAEREIQAKIDEQLDRLGAGVTAAEHERLMKSAARALAAGSARAARPHLDMLGWAVDRFVERAGKRAGQAVTAARLLEGIDFLGRQDELGERDREVVAALQDVVDGSGELHDLLLSDAEDLRDRAIGLARRLHQTERLTALLTELGYDVSEGFGTAREPGRTLNLVRPDWPDHRVNLMVGDRGAGGVVVRNRPVAGDDAARQDRERCETWTADFRRIADRLRGEGVEIESLRVSAADPVQYAEAETAGDDTTAAEAAPRARTREQDR
ncbi:hypothetical protein [Actinomadura sp. 9N215]|uniref:hypothetical protein n=1 Tax=Actinomadura sp. 9N215 TaxID=3375150 RepID=UPI0037A1A8B6